MTNHKKYITLTGIIIACTIVVGCMTIEEIAPPVDNAITAASQGIDRQSLQRGRQLYLGKCAKCHSPEPITGYTLEKWQEIMPRMNSKTKLNQQESTDVSNYVYSVRKLMQ